MGRLDRGRAANKIREGTRPREDVAFHPEYAIRGRLDAPAHEHDPPPVNFQPRDPARVGASARVEVGRVTIDRVHRTMGMPTNQGEMVFCDPMGEDIFDFAALLDVLGGAGWVVNAEELKRPPQLADQELDKSLEVDFPKIGLVPVQDKKFTTRFGMAKDQPLVDFDAGEEGFAFAGRFVGGPMELLGDHRRIGTGQIVIAIDQVQAPFPVKPFEQFKDVMMGGVDVGERAVFEQFVAVADFDVGVAVGVVMLEGVEEEDFVGDKVIRPRAISPMGIAKKNQAGLVVEGKARGGLKNFGKMMEGIHSLWRFFLS